MAPKKQKQSLADFLADEATGKVNWADDLDDLPSGPITRLDRNPMPRRGDDWLSSMPDRAERDSRGGMGSAGPGAGGGGFRDSYNSQREELPLPTSPPYTAFVGNLSFECLETDVADFFAPNKTLSVRLVSGPDGRPKGFGYVEFETLDGLKDGLARSGAQMNGRTVRISVAEPRDAKGPGFSSVAEEASQWRRSGPLPPSNDGPGRRGPGGSTDRGGFSRYEGSGGGFDNMEVGPGGRAGFGSRFSASAAPASGPPREPRRPESLEPSQGDNASDWRTGKPVSEAALSPTSNRRPSASPAAGADGNARGSSFRRQGDANEVDEKYSSQERLGFGSKFVPTPPESPSMQKRPGFGFDRRNTAGSTNLAGDNADTWRSARRTSDNKAGQQAGSPNGGASTGEPTQRKKLELKPRSTPVGADVDGATATTPTTDANKGGNNPFGSAKPVDAAEREREIEAKMAQREKERKDEERQRREKAKASAAEKAPENAPTGPKASRARGVSRGEKGSTGNGAPSSNARSSPKTADAKTAAVTTTNGHANTNSSAAPSPVPSPSAVKAVAAAPKQPPPTGAWGGGRKPSGALATKEELEEQQKQQELAQSKEQDKGSDDKAVSEATKAVEAATISA